MMQNILSKMFILNLMKPDYRKILKIRKLSFRMSKQLHKARMWLSVIIMEIS